MTLNDKHMDNLVENLFEGFAYCQIVFDDRGNARDLIFLRVNRTFQQLTLWDDVIGKSVFQIVPNAQLFNPHLLDAIQRIIATGAPEKFEVDAQALRRWLSVALYRPEPGYLILLIDDITERKRAEAQLRDSQELFALFMRHSPIYAFIKESTPTASRVIQASDNYIEMIGIAGRAMIGKTMEELFPAELAAKITADDWAVVSQGVTLKLDEELDGRCYTTHKFPITRGAQTLIAGYTIDITERKHAEEQLRYLGTHDPLTGIFNRAFFETELTRLQASREFPISIVIADVDDLKITNDKLGHAAGDALIQRAARALQTTFRASDIIARIGGDEFAVLLPQTDAATVEQMLARIRHHLAAENGETSAAPVQLSLGVATTFGGALGDTFKLADARMYEDKSAHKQVTAQTHHLATHDALTGAFNRAFFEIELARLEPSREFPISVVVANVENLKTTNETQSYTAGDALLKRTARALQIAFRASDLIARIAGNEFAIILPKTDAPAVTRAIARVQDHIVRLNVEQPDLFLQIAIGSATCLSGNLKTGYAAARAAAQKQRD